LNYTTAKIPCRYCTFWKCKYCKRETKTTQTIYWCRENCSFWT